jgi:AhpD family alkylhydroperoxidase
LNTFPIHTFESAPAESVPALRTLEEGLGFVPNLAATMAESPVLITGFVDLRKTLAGSELTGVEREIVALAVSIENDCDYCMAAHSTFALMQNAEEDDVAAARAGDPPADPKLGPLYEFARSLVRKRGHLTPDETQALLDAGYSRGALLEVVTQVGHTTLANLAHSISNAPVDAAFAPQSL